VRDARHLTHPDDMATALFEHLDLAYNKGNLTPIMTVFNPGTPERPAVRLWNPQLLRYAAYRTPTGQVVGDPAQLSLTDAIEALGWRGAGGRFDLLPIVIAVAGQRPRYYEIPAAQRHEVRIRHPKYPGIEELGLQWYTVPAVSDMALDCGGVRYRCAPFNGWYMATEIGARNFTDVGRYNLLLQIAEKIGADTRRESTLWRDKALTAVTEAVLWSFEAEGVKIADHYSASLEFLQFCRNEQESAREIHGHWPWLVPPIGGSATPLFLDQWTDVEIKPALVMQEPAYG
jgi:nitric-oxide synthase